MSKKNIFVGISGASGICYGLRLIKVLLELGHNLHTAFSREALANAKAEFEKPYENIEELLSDHGLDKIKVYNNDDLAAAPSSGSFLIDSYIIAPASMGIIARAATGVSSSLIERACDVALKERRKLLFLFREMPLSSIHLNNMLTLSNNGAIIMPAAPGFYHAPKSIEELIDFVIARVLDQLDIEHSLAKRWQ